MEYKDYYSVLGIERTATQDEAKRAYRKLARKFHPDVNKDPGAEDRFKEIGEAYEVLRDADKRAGYDQLGTDWKQGQDFQPPPDWDAGFEFTGAGSSAGRGAAHDYSDFFERVFAGMQRGDAGAPSGAEFHARGEDHHARISIDLRDVFEGATRDIALRAPEVDESGHLRLRNRTLSVKIPKGITDGQTIRLKGKGSPGMGRLPAGDLYLEVSFKPDRLYRVSGRDLYLDLPIAPWEAALGASIETPTPTGPIMMKVPPNSFQGRKLRVKGRGLPADTPGDLYAVLNISLPSAETAEEKKAYLDMQKNFKFDPRSKLGV